MSQRMPPSFAPGSDDSRTDGVHGRLNPVVDLELHEDVRDVVLHRLRADVELGRDECVVLAVRDELQYLDLAVGKLGADELLDPRVRARGANTLKHLLGDMWGDERLAACGGPDPRDELLDRGVLQEIAARSGEDRVGDVAV